MNRDAALYALGVGACARDALDKNELKYVYHQDGQQSIQVLKNGGGLKMSFVLFYFPFTFLAASLNVSKFK